MNKMNNENMKFVRKNTFDTFVRQSIITCNLKGSLHLGIFPLKTIILMSLIILL